MTFRFRARPAAVPNSPGGSPVQSQPWSEWQDSTGGGLYAIAFQRVVDLMEEFGSTALKLNGRNMKGEWVEWQIEIVE